MHITSRLVHIALTHPVALWLLVVILVVIVFGVMDLDPIDNGIGSLTLSVLMFIGAPFLVVWRLGMAATSWAPVWVQIVTSACLVLGVTMALDHLVARLLRRYRGPSGRA